MKRTNPIYSIRYLKLSFVVNCASAEQLFTYFLCRCATPATVIGLSVNEDSVCSRSAAKVTRRL